jgi:hypothetical protein
VSRRDSQCVETVLVEYSGERITELCTGRTVCVELMSETKTVHVNSGLELRANSGRRTVESYEKVTSVLDLQQR